MKRLLLLLGSWLLLATVAFAAATAQDATPIDVQAGVTPATLTVGDVVTLTLTVTHPAGYRVVPLFDLGSTPAVELLHTQPAAVQATADGRERSILPLHITAWQTGDVIVAPTDLRVSDPGGGLSLWPVPPVVLTVDSVLEPGDVAPRGLKPQAVLALPVVWTYWAAGGLALLLAGVLVGRRIARRQTAHPADRQRPLPPPHVVALAELDAIERADYVGQGDFKTLYSRVADALRRYLEAAYHVAALERTTAELRRSLSADTDLTDATRQHLVALLGQADLVKFARLAPDVDAARALPEEARRIIRATLAQRRREEAAQ